MTFLQPDFAGPCPPLPSPPSPSREQKEDFQRPPSTAFVHHPNGISVRPHRAPLLSAAAAHSAAGALTGFCVSGGRCTRASTTRWGAMHLMSLALRTLKDKGVKISAAEGEAALGRPFCCTTSAHGPPLPTRWKLPFSKDVPHEQLSLFLMQRPQQRI